MRKFFLSLGLFFVLMVAINLLGYVYISKNVLYKNYIIPARKFNSYHSLLLGDSHSNAIRQIDLDQLGVGNFSFDGDSYFDILSKTDYLIPRHKPDTIYLCIDDHTLSKYREWWTNKERSIYYASYSLYRKYYHLTKRQFLFKKYGLFYFPFFNTKNSKIFGAYLKSRFHPMVERDYTNCNFADTPEQNRIERSIDRIKTQFPSQESSTLLQQCLNEIIEICTKNHITLIGIKFPLTNEYLDALGDRSYHADTVLQNRGVPVLDFTTSLMGRDSLFRDQDHLNNEGSKVFVNLMTRQLTKRITTGNQ